MQLDALQVWLFDSKGLVVRSRGDAEDLEDHKLAFLHRKPAEQETYKDLLTAVQTVKPSVIIGISSVPPTIAFEQVQHFTDVHNMEHIGSCVCCTSWSLQLVLSCVLALSGSTPCATHCTLIGRGLLPLSKHARTAAGLDQAEYHHTSYAICQSCLHLQY